MTGPGLELELKLELELELELDFNLELELELELELILVPSLNPFTNGFNSFKPSQYGSIRNMAQVDQKFSANAS